MQGTFRTVIDGQYLSERDVRSHPCWCPPPDLAVSSIDQVTVWQPGGTEWKDVLTFGQYAVRALQAGLAIGDNMAGDALSVGHEGGIAQFGRASTFGRDSDRNAGLADAVDVDEPRRLAVGHGRRVWSRPHGIGPCLLSCVMNGAGVAFGEEAHDLAVDGDGFDSMAGASEFDDAVEQVAESRERYGVIAQSGAQLAHERVHVIELFLLHGSSAKKTSRATHPGQQR